MATHQMRSDGNGAVVAGWEGASDTLVMKENQLVSITATLTTTPTGNLTVPTVPIAALTRAMDYAGNLTNNYGISIVGGSTAYYPINVDPTAGTMTVVTTPNGTTTVNSTSVTITYFFLAPVKGTLNSDNTITPTVNVQALGALPSDIQAHLTSTNTAINAVALTISTGATPSTTSSPITCDGFNEINIGAWSSVSHQGNFQIIWSYDNTNFNLYEKPTGDKISNDTTGTMRFGTVPVRAPYCKIMFQNSDTTATPTVTVMTYLKA